jgi:hypothetical protein
MNNEEFVTALRELEEATSKDKASIKACKKALRDMREDHRMERPPGEGRREPLDAIGRIHLHLEEVEERLDRLEQIIVKLMR